MDVEVFVVGAGPVGLTAAVELARYGLSVRIVDKVPQRSDKSKALAIWSRTLELMDRSGTSDALVAAGNKAEGTQLMAGAKRIAHIALASLPSAYNYVLLLPQDETERILEERLEALGVRVERGVEMSAFAAAADRVTATLSYADGGTKTLAAAWLVACDGAHSPVRHALGKAFVGSTVPTSFILADVHLRGAHLASNEIAMFAHREGLLALFPIRNDRFRIIADLGPTAGAPPSEPVLADVQAILDVRGPGGIVASDPIWLSSFRINERIVEDYRSGRVFLAGDAAHVHSPAGGQGMNTGMQDACNLAWKLALVQRGTCAEEPLLASYSAERSPIARKVLQDSGRLTSVMTVRDAAVQSIRNYVAGLLFGIAPVRNALANTLSEISVGYPSGPLTQHGPRSATGPNAGERAPIRAAEARVGAGTTPRFALFAEPGKGAEDVPAQFSSLMEPTLRAPFAPGTSCLVRPDGYVCAVESDVRRIHTYLEGLCDPSVARAR